MRMSPYTRRKRTLNSPSYISLPGTDANYFSRVQFNTLLLRAIDFLSSKNTRRRAKSDNSHRSIDSLFLTISRDDIRNCFFFIVPLFVAGTYEEVDTSKATRYPKIRFVRTDKFGWNTAKLYSIAAYT